MKQPAVDRFARFVKIGMGAVIGAAAVAVFYTSNCVSLRNSAVLENVPSGITASVQSPADISAENSQSAVSAPPEVALININTASSEELQTLPGIGEAKAAAIIAYREEHGAFDDISEIMNVSGIGEKIFGDIRDKITTGGENIPPAVSSQSTVSAPPEFALININAASSEELQTLPGIGEAKAAAIIAYREDHGAFADISEIMNVSGIGEKIFEKIRGQITV